MGVGSPPPEALATGPAFVKLGRSNPASRKRVMVPPLSPMTIQTGFPDASNRTAGAA